MGGAIDGAMQMFGATVQGGSDIASSRLQYLREQQQANAAIEGAQEKGAFNQEKLKVAQAQLASAQNVAYANSGVDPGTGTAAQVRANTAAVGELDAQTAAINAAREVWGYQQARQQSAEDAQMRDSNARQKDALGVLGGFAKFTAGALQTATGK